MPIVAVMAMAIAVIETNKCHKGTKQGKHKGNNHRLKPNEFLSRLAKPIIRSSNE
jgi:hypothetical protein